MRANRGFTLVEILVVLVVVGLVVSLAPLTFERLLPSVRLEAGARELAESLREARSRAIRENRSWFVEIDTDARVARVGADGRGRALPADAQVTLTVASIERLSEVAGRIRFFPDGTSTGGEIALTAGQNELVVEVDWFDGRVSVVDVPAS